MDSTAYRWGRVLMIEDDRSFGDYNCPSNKTGAINKVVQYQVD